MVRGIEYQGLAGITAHHPGQSPSFEERADIGPTNMTGEEATEDRDTARFDPSCESRENV